MAAMSQMAFRETTPGGSAPLGLRRDLRGETYLNGWGLASPSPRLAAEECRDEHLYLMGGRPLLTASTCQDVEPSLGETSTIGLDLAKHVFQAHRGA